MTTENAVEAKPILPPSVSADAKRNAFYTKCPEQQSTKPYAMCQYIAANQGDDSIKTLYGDCLSAIHRGRCVAVGMREEEELKGQAIYFVERVKGEALVAAQTTWAASSPKRGYQRNKYSEGATLQPAPRVAIPRPSTPAPAPKKPAFEFDGNIYAAALNAAVKKERNATNDQATPAKVTPVAAAPVAPTPAPQPEAAPAPINMTRRAGESPLEMARRLRAQQGSK
jgi:hypothetical protein